MRFEKYFETPPVKRGRGRPKGVKKKKTSGRPKIICIDCEGPSTPKQTMLSRTPSKTIDLTVKQAEELDARLEGSVEKKKREQTHRINWDDAKHAPLRKRIADSWMQKNDLYCAGDSFGRFYIKMHIHRNVLKRYLDGKYLGDKVKSRGRPSLLCKNVMQHLCEGAFNLGNDVF